MNQVDPTESSLGSKSLNPEGNGADTTQNLALKRKHSSRKYGLFNQSASYRKKHLRSFYEQQLLEGGGGGTSIKYSRKSSIN